MTSPRPGVLNGWKEIAGYVARDIRTVERWEKQRGLPVRRVPGAGRANVYANITELEEWLKGSAHFNDADSSIAAVGLEDGARGAPDVRPETPQRRRGDPGGGLRLTAADGLPVPGDRLEAQAAETAPGREAEASPALYVQMPEGDGVERRRALSSPAGRGLDPTPTSGPMRRVGVWAHSRWVAMASLMLLVTGTGMAVSYAVRASGRTPEVASAPSAEAPAVPVKASKVPGVEDLYLCGMYLYEQRRPETLTRALEKFSQAVAMDPGYAPAFVGLANTYNLLREYSAMSDQEAYPKARAAAERAIALDPNLAQAHASLGFIDYFWGWDAQASEREFQRAEELDPRLELAHHWHGSVLTHQGRYAEALRELNVAEQLSPSSSAVLTSRALALGLSGRRDEAVGLLKEMLQQGLPDSKDQATRDAGSSTAHAVLGILYMQEPADVARALEEFERCAALRKDAAGVREMQLDEANLKRLGVEEMRRRALEREEKLHPGRQDRTMRMAYLEAALGMTDASFADLEQLARRHDTSIGGIWMASEFRQMRQDPRFTQLRAAMGLPAM